MFPETMNFGQWLEKNEAEIQKAFNVFDESPLRVHRLLEKCWFDGRAELLDCGLNKLIKNKITLQGEEVKNK